MPVDISTLSSTPSEDKESGRRGKSRAEKVRNLYINTNTGQRQRWQSNEQKAYEFFLNEQLTQDQRDELVAAGMPDFIINRITPVIETMKYFVTANSPRWEAVGRSGEDVDLAEVHTSIIDYCWYISDGKAMFSQIILDCLTKGKGYILINVDPDDDRGMGEVKFKRIDPFDVYVASMSHDPFERDAAYQIIKKDIPRSDLIRMLPAYESQIRRAQGDQEGQAYTEREVEESDAILPEDVETQKEPDEGYEDEILPYYEVYKPVKLPYYNLTVLIEPSESEFAEAKAGIDEYIDKIARELQVQLVEKQQELQRLLQDGEIVRERYELELDKAADEVARTIQEQRAILIERARQESSKLEQKIVTEKEYQIMMGSKELKDTIKDAVKYYQPRVNLECVVGDQFLYEETLNISFSPLIAIPYMHTGTPYPMSAVTPLVGKQQEINKAHQIMVHNANLSSNLRWKFVEGEIDEGLWEDYSASPGALLPYRPGFSNEGPVPVLPQPINNAFFTIEQDSKSDLEYMAGIHPPSMGIPSQREEPYRGLLAKDEFSTRRIRSWTSNYLEPALEHIGKVFQEMAQDTYNVQKIFRIVQPNPGGGYEAREISINVPLYDDMGEEIGRFHNYAASRYDIRFVAGSTLPINRWAVLEEYKQYLELGVIDDIAFLQETDIKNKEALMKRKSRLAQLEQQLAQMEEALKDRDGTIETLSRQLVQAGIKSKVQDAAMELDRSRTETKMEDKLVQERMRDALKNLRDEAKLAIKESKAKKSEKS